MPCAEYTAMVTYLTPDMETQKHRSESATLYIDYPTGVYDVRREFHNNRPELEKLDSLMPVSYTHLVVPLIQQALIPQHIKQIPPLLQKRLIH